MATRTARRQHERVFVEEDRGFQGMNDDPAALLPSGWVRRAQNLLLENGHWLGRPGMEYYGRPDAAAVTGGMTVYGFTRNGAYRELAFFNGRMFKRDGANRANAWSEVTLGAGVVLSWAAAPQCVMFNNKLIATDGVNQPWSWDETNFALLSNAPVATGVTVYYSKLFFWGISGAPYTFRWSEEFTENTGYVAGGFNNEWKFAPADEGHIVKMVGTNEALLVFKRDTIARITGPVETNFQTDAVREAISTSGGIIGLRAGTLVDADFYYLSQEGPRVLPAGGPPVDIGSDKIGTFWRDEVDRTFWSAAEVVYDVQHDLVLFAVPVKFDNRDGPFGTNGPLHKVAAYRPPRGQDPGWWTFLEFPDLKTLAASYQPWNSSGNAYGKEHGKAYVLMGTTGGAIARFGLSDELTSDYVDLVPQMIQDPSDPTTANWTAVGVTVVKNTTDVTAPDGTQTAHRLTPTVADDAYLFQTIADQRYNGTFTISIWMRTLFGTATLRPINLVDDMGLAMGDAAVIDTLWRKYTTTGTLRSIHSAKRILIGGLSTYTDADPAVYFWSPYAQFDGVVLEQVLVPRDMGADRPGQKCFSRAEFDLRVPTDLTLETTPLANGYTRGVKREGFLAAKAETDRYSRGLNLLARSCAVELRSAQVGQRLAVQRARLIGCYTGDYPENADA